MLNQISWFLNNFGFGLIVTGIFLRRQRLFLLGCLFEEGFDFADIEVVLVQIFVPFFVNLIPHDVHVALIGTYFSHLGELLECLGIREVDKPAPLSPSILHLALLQLPQSILRFSPGLQNLFLELHSDNCRRGHFSNHFLVAFILLRVAVVSLMIR